MRRRNLRFNRDAITLLFTFQLCFMGDTQREIFKETKGLSVRLSTVFPLKYLLKSLNYYMRAEENIPQGFLVTPHSITKNISIFHSVHRSQRKQPLNIFVTLYTIIQHRCTLNNSPEKGHGWRFACDLSKCTVGMRRWGCNARLAHTGLTRHAEDLKSGDFSLL